MTVTRLGERSCSGEFLVKAALLIKVKERLSFGDINLGLRFAAFL